MKAKRIPVPDDGNIFAALKDPGDYCGPVDGFIPGAKKADGSYEQVKVRRVAFLLPITGTAHLHHCQEPPHKFTEEPDGTLTITASILATGGIRERGSSYTWHGYLTKGEWITA